jgi:hypothetical protein
MTLRASSLVLLVLGLAGCTDIGAEEPPSAGDASAGSVESSVKESAAPEAEASSDSRDDADAHLDSPGDGLRPVLSDGPVYTANHLLLAQSSDCLACAETHCDMYISACDTVSGLANGPAAGRQRSELCSETLACLLRTGCGPDALVCYCGPNMVMGLPTDCILYPDQNTGKCRAEIERSSESTDPKAILEGLYSGSTASTWAASLRQCLRDNSCDACSPRGDAGSQ